MLDNISLLALNAYEVYSLFDQMMAEQSDLNARTTQQVNLEQKADHHFSQIEKKLDDLLK
jgi:hypothetical protein